MKNNIFKILFIGDIVGRPGRICVRKFLEENRSQYDFVIANVENASHGFGLTLKNHDELISYGIDAMTSGNHIWDKKDVYVYIDESPCLIRPYNYNPSVKGVGYKIFKDKIVVINLLGRTFMPPIDCPFTALDNILDKNDFKDKIILVDFHAEATAEKQCFAHYALTRGVSAVLGTHTHIQTADETILENKLAYITDAGFCGSTRGIIGMKYDTSLKRLITSISERFDIEDAYPYALNGVEIEFEGNCPKSIRRINFEYNSEDSSDEN